MTDKDILEEHHNALANETLDEMGNQIEKWGEQHHPDGTGGETARREADVAKALTDSNAQFGKLTWKDILNEEVKEAFAETNRLPLRAELIQVAAVALSWARDIDGRPIEGAPRDAHTRTYVGPQGVGSFDVDERGIVQLTEEALHDLFIAAGYAEAPSAQR